MTAICSLAAPLLRVLLLGCLAWGAFAAPVLAEDDADDEFETGWIGLRLGGWYRPEIQLEALVSGDSFFGGGGTIGGTTFNVERDLGVTQSVESDFFPVDQGVTEAEVFFDSEWISISLEVVAPHAYRGKRVLERSINFAGATFSAGVAIETKLRQFTGGAQVKLNLFNNRFFAISPLVGMRVLALDWKITGQILGDLPNVRRGVDLSTLNGPLNFRDFQVLPYPEVGVEVKVGLRKWFEVDAKLTGFYLDFFGIQGGAIEAELGATVFPIPNLGIRLSYRYLSVDFEARRSSSSSNFFEFDLNFHGPSLSVIVRF